jgi:hypothetical protein
MEPIRFTGKRNKRSLPIWEYRCHCGKVFEALKHSVRYGNTKSCGCLRRKHAQTIGLARAQEHTTSIYDDHALQAILRAV